MRKRRSSGGWLLTELVVTAGLLTLVMVALAVAGSTFADLNRYQTARQQCMAAAQAQLESLATTGREMPPEDIQRLWPGVTITVQGRPGEGQWTGLVCLSAVARTESRGREVRVEFGRYVGPTGGERQP